MRVRTVKAIRRWIRVCMFVVIAGLAIAPRLTAQTLTNADVMKMVQAKLSDALIISEMKHSTCKFDTSPNALIRLKEAGVSDKVLEAMTEAGHAEGSEGTIHQSNANAATLRPGELGPNREVIDASNVSLLQSHVLAHLNGNIDGIDTSDDGRTLAVWVTGSDMGANIFDLTTGALITRIDGARLPITLSPSGRLLASGTQPPGSMLGSSGDVSIWDTHTGRRLHLLHSGASTLTGKALVFSPKGDFLASAGNSLIAIWHMPEGTFEGSIAGSEELAFSGNGRFLAVYDNGGDVDVWDLRTMRIITAASISPITGGEQVLFIRCSRGDEPGGPAVLIGTTRRTIRVRHSARTVGDEHGGPVEVIGTAGRTIRVRHPPGTVRNGNLSIPGSLVAISPNASIGVSVGKYVGRGPGGYSPVTFLDLRSGLVLAKKNDPDIVSAAAFSKDGRKLIFGTMDGEIVVWDVGGEKGMPRGTATNPARQDSSSPNPAPASPSASTHPDPACNGATDLGYSIQFGTHTYRVEGFGPPGPNRVHVFLDETGAVVRDKSLLQRLAFGAGSVNRRLRGLRLLFREGKRGDLRMT